MTMEGTTSFEDAYLLLFKWGFSEPVMLVFGVVTRKENEGNGGFKLQLQVDTAGWFRNPADTTTWDIFETL